MISREAKTIERALHIMKMRKIVSRMMLQPKRHAHRDDPPRIFYRKYDIRSDRIKGGKCFTLKSSARPAQHIFYFHGGAYTVQANMIHWRLIGHILDHIPCEITFVNYPLAPESTCAETIAMVREAYVSLQNANGQEMILMGDSAGGGLALALAQLIKREGIEPIPSKLVLFSPWLDISMDNDIPEDLQRRDLVLSTESLREAGQKYAGDYDTKNFFCSPLYGDLIGIGDLALFTGTNEILHVQAVQLKEKLSASGQRCTYFEYEGMQHVWFGLPIPEAKDALAKTIAFLETASQPQGICYSR